MANLVTKIAKWFMRVFVLGFTLFFSYATFVAWRDNILSGKVVATSLLVIGVLLTVAVFLPGGPFLLSEVYWGRRIKREEIHWIEHKPNEYYIVYSKDKEDFLDRLMMGDNDTLAQARRLLWKGIAIFLTTSVLGLAIGIAGVRVYHIPEMRVAGLLCLLPSVNILILLLMFQWIISRQRREQR